MHARLTGADPLTVPAGLTAEALTGLTVELTGALSWWRAEPYPELDRHPAADAERARLADLRLAAVADRARLHLALGQESTVVADLGPVAHDHPLREDLWALFALALARAGRQGMPCTRCAPSGSPWTPSSASTRARWCGSWNWRSCARTSSPPARSPDRCREPGRLRDPTRPRCRPPWR
ncbi:MAG: BTAD domain-containing putative transcriptional regulator [Nakamurella multipartita]